VIPVCATLLTDGRVDLGSQFLPLSKSVCAETAKFSQFAADKRKTLQTTGNFASPDTFSDK